MLSYGEHAKTFVNNMKFFITILRAFSIIILLFGLALSGVK